MPEAPKPITIDSPVTITIDGTEVTAQKGDLLIDACERAGTFIPRFCYHPRMNPVGMCRMCLVEVDSGRGPALQPSCMIECGDGMSVTTESDLVKKVQDGVLEYLLLNHPLDCPVCDKGGECPLQDNTMAFGPGESRWVEEKRHYAKPIPISETVNLDRERCILCDRCTRFADQVAGDPLIHFMDRGANTQINTFPGEPFSSYFSGNTVQVCPVGALTATPYRFKARPWDLKEVDSTCVGCAVGCRITVQSSRDQLLRYNGVDSDAVNWSWLCDKGRFGFEAVNSDDRLTQPMVRQGDALVGTRWSDALAEAGRLVADGLSRGGADGFAVLGGARLTNEAAYAWAKLAKGVIGSDNVDAQMGDGLPADAVLGLPRATINDACRPGGTVILLGPDPKETLGVLYIRLKHAIVEDGATLIEVTPRRTGLSRYAAASLTYRPGEAAAVVAGLLGSGTGAAGDRTGSAAETVAGIDPADIAAAKKLLDAASGPVTVILGRASIAESAATVVDAAALLADRLDGVRFLSALTRSNVQGALDMGLAPGLLPGRVRRGDATAWFDQAWPTVPGSDGLDAAGILQAAADGRIDTLVLLGADPLADFVDRELAERALTGARNVIAVDMFLTASSRRADVVLPAVGFAEQSGTTTNLEGRVTILNQKVTAPGSARTDWSIAVDLADRLGADLGFESPEEIWAEIEELSMAHAGVTLDLLASEPTEGIVVPLPAPEPVVIDEPEVTDTDDDTQVSAAAEDESPDQAQSDAPEPTTEDAGADLIEAPELLTFGAGAATTVPAVDAYALRLVATRTMYDHGTLAQHAASAAGLAPEPTLRLHPSDYDRVGVPADGRVKVTSGNRNIVVAASIDASLPRGTASLDIAGGDITVTSLIDHAAAVTDIRLEAAR